MTGRTRAEPRHPARPLPLPPAPLRRALVQECRLALLEDGRLESIHVSTINRTQTRNNIYKARIVAIEPNLQAAFVEIGTERNGFLPFDEIHPEYYREDVDERCRQMIADPEAAGKILSGKGGEITRCEECMSCFASLGQGKPLACKVNKGLPGSQGSRD